MTITAIMLGIQQPNLPPGRSQIFLADVYRKVIIKALPPAPRSVPHNMTALKDANRKKLRNMIIKTAPISQPALSKKAKMSASTVRSIIKEFEETGFVWMDKNHYPWRIRITEACNEGEMKP